MLEPELAGHTTEAASAMSETFELVRYEVEPRPAPGLVAGERRYLARFMEEPGNG